jgi:integrase
MKINIKYNPQYPKKQTSNIMISISFEGIRIQLSIGISIENKYWDFKKSKIKSQYQNSFALNRKLDFIKSEIEEFYFKRKAVNEDVTKVQIKEVFYNTIGIETNSETDDKQKNDITFFEGIEKIYNDKKQSGNYSPFTIKKDKTCLNHLESFFRKKHKKYNWEEINTDFFEEFSNFLIHKQGLTNSSAIKILVILKTMLNLATDKGYNNDYSFVKAFAEVKKKIKVSNEDYIVALNEKEFELLQDYKPDTKKLEKVKDLFILQIYLGVRISDLKSISLDNIDKSNNLIHIYQKKTKDYLSIPIHAKIQRILDKYLKGLPAISDQKYNEYIKELCKKAGINQRLIKQKMYGNKIVEEVYPKWKLISSHTARRTFITLSLKKGILPEYVMKVSGHKSRKSFEKYIKITRNEAHDAIRNAWGQ